MLNIKSPTPSTCTKSIDHKVDHQVPFTGQRNPSSGEYVLPSGDLARGQSQVAYSFIQTSQTWPVQTPSPLSLALPAIPSWPREIEPTVNHGNSAEVEMLHEQRLAAPTVGYTPIPVSLMSRMTTVITHGEACATLMYHV